MDTVATGGQGMFLNKLDDMIIHSGICLYGNCTTPLWRLLYVI